MVEDATECKKHACQFLNINICELCETLPEYTNNKASYNEFYKVICCLYPGSEEERKWLVADMDKLVGESSKIGISSLSDLGEYYCQFLVITSFLLSKDHISTTKQGHTFTCSFQSELWGCISQCLQLKFSDHFPDDLYKLQGIHDATRFILHGTSAMFQLASSDSSCATHGTKMEPSIKTKDLATMFEQITKTFVKALANQPAQALTMLQPPHA